MPFGLIVGEPVAARRKFPVRLVVILAPLVISTAVLLPLLISYRTIALRGAVVRESDDVNKRSPIAGVQIAASDGKVVVTATSDTSGAFGITLRRTLLSRHAVTLSFRHPDYKPLDISDPSKDRLYVASMVPVAQAPAAPVQADRPTVAITNVSVRYTVKTAATADIGSGVKTFTVTNTGNVPCNGHRPCSPDGKWKAAVASASLDSGKDNEFRNGRVSCIAGPCPFTAIERDNFSGGGRTISVTVLNWSDTTTFLLQAEAFRRMVIDSIRKAFPVIFDNTMNFSLPAAAQGTCIEAEVDGTAIVFPIGPNLSLSWTDCSTQMEGEQDILYRCEIKPGYVFR